MKTPLFDDIFIALLRRDLDALRRIAEERPADVVSLRAVVSTQRAQGATPSIDLGTIRQEAPWVVPLFEGPRFFFVSERTIIQERLTGGFSAVPIDHSFSFDSNVAEKIRAYFNHEKISDADLARVITLLRLKKRCAMQVDWGSFLFENLRLSRDNSQNLRPTKTIAALKALDDVDWDEFEKDASNPVTTRSWQELEKEAISTYDSLITDAEVKDRETKALFTNVFLLALAEQWLTHNEGAPRAFSNLIDFCLFDLGKVPPYELGLAWDFLVQPKALRFFGPLSDLARDLTNALKGMAWDLSHVRSLETMATMHTMTGSFFLPFFITFDAGLTELIRHNQTRFILIDDRSKRLQSG